MGAVYSLFGGEACKIIMLTFGLDYIQEYKLLEGAIETGIISGGVDEVSFPIGGFSNKRRSDEFILGYFKFTGRSNVRPILDQHYATTDAIILMLPEKFCLNPYMIDYMKEITSRKELSHAIFFVLLTPQSDENNNTANSETTPRKAREESSIDEQVMRQQLETIILFPGQTLQVVSLTSTDNREEMHRVMSLVSGAVKGRRIVRRQEAELKKRDKQQQGKVIHKAWEKLAHLCKSVLMY